MVILTTRLIGRGTFVDLYLKLAEFLLTLGGNSAVHGTPTPGSSGSGLLLIVYRPLETETETAN
jgi:hypothetical protein